MGPRRHSRLRIAILTGSAAVCLKSGWIPVTERLPENGAYVLMSFEKFPLASTGYYVGNKETGGNWNLANWIDEYTCLANDLFVNAWMPLPEPYREDEEEWRLATGEKDVHTGR